MLQPHARVQDEQRGHAVRRGRCVAEIARDGAAVLDLPSADLAGRQPHAVEPCRQIGFDRFGPRDQRAELDAVREAANARERVDPRDVQNRWAVRVVQTRSSPTDRGGVGRVHVGAAREDPVRAVAQEAERVAQGLRACVRGHRLRASGEQFAGGKAFRHEGHSDPQFPPVNRTRERPGSPLVPAMFHEGPTRIPRFIFTVGRISRRRNPTSGAPSPCFMSDYAALIRPTGYGRPFPLSPAPPRTSLFVKTSWIDQSLRGTAAGFAAPPRQEGLRGTAIWSNLLRRETVRTSPADASRVTWRTLRARLGRGSPAPRASDSQRPASIPVGGAR